MNLHPMCENIGYFGQDNDRHDGADTTNSILRKLIITYLFIGYYIIVTIYLLFHCYSLKDEFTLCVFARLSTSFSLTMR